MSSPWFCIWEENKKLSELINEQTTYSLIVYNHKTTERHTHTNARIHTPPTHFHSGTLNVFMAYLNNALKIHIIYNCKYLLVMKMEMSVKTDEVVLLLLQFPVLGTQWNWIHWFFIFQFLFLFPSNHIDNVGERLLII